MRFLFASAHLFCLFVYFCSHLCVFSLLLRQNCVWSTQIMNSSWKMKRLWSWDYRCWHILFWRSDTMKYKSHMIFLSVICDFKIIFFYIPSYFRYRYHRPAHVSWATLNGKTCTVVISETRFCGGLVCVNQWLLSATDRFWAVLLVHAVVGIFNVLRVGWCIGIMISNEREQTWDLQQSQTINQYQFHCFPMWRERSNHRRLNGSPGKAKSSKDGWNPRADAEYRDMDMASK